MTGRPVAGGAAPVLGVGIGPGQLGGQLAASKPIRGAQVHGAPDDLRLVAAALVPGPALGGRDGGCLPGADLSAAEDGMEVPGVGLVGKRAVGNHLGQFGSRQHHDAAPPGSP